MPTLTRRGYELVIDPAGWVRCPFVGRDSHSGLCGSCPWLRDLSLEKRRVRCDPPAPDYPEP